MGDVLLSEEEFEALRVLVAKVRETISGNNRLMQSAKRITRDDIATPMLRQALNDVDNIDFENPRRPAEPQPAERAKPSARKNRA